MTFDEAYSVLNGTEPANFDSTFSIYRACADLLISDEQEGIGLLIEILDKRERFDRGLDHVLSELVESVGFYPYLEKERLSLKSTDSLLRRGNAESDFLKGKIFHDEQKLILDILRSGKNLVVSAPTSFGKSLLIEEMVASKQYKNIVIIQPTLALLDETRKKLYKYSEQYKIIVRTNQEFSEERGNLFLLTAERVNEYEQFPQIDLLVIDEFYKLSARRDDERSSSLNNAFHYLLNKFNCQFYLLGPNIDEISPGFTERFNAVFYKTSFSLVSCKTHDIYLDHKGKFGVRGKKKEYKEKVLFELLDSLSDEQTIIYCSSPPRARKLAAAYLKHLRDHAVEPHVGELPITEWIKKYVSENWSLVKLLGYGIGFHDGALQRHLTSSITELFNDQTINFLFCTATMIEGVNTSAKNIVYFDEKKGQDKPIDYFDYSNIRGRAGRLMQHYIGNIYNFNEPPKKDEIYVDIPFFEQNPIADEVLINIVDVKNRDSEQFSFLDSLPEVEREIFSKNTINIRGQESLLKFLREDIWKNYNLLAWDFAPSYWQLSYCLGLAWNFLRNPDEKSGTMTKDRLIKVTFDYGFTQSIFGLVSNSFLYQRSLEKNEAKSDNEILDEAICDSFQILRHWFQYKVPKWLIVVHELQKFVCSEIGLRAGSYTHYAGLIENDFIRPNLSILAEYGIPKSAIEKLAPLIGEHIEQDKVLDEIKKRELYNVDGIMEYERKKIIESFK